VFNTAAAEQCKRSGIVFESSSCHGCILRHDIPSLEVRGQRLWKEKQGQHESSNFDTLEAGSHRHVTSRTWIFVGRPRARYGVSVENGEAHKDI
jgi:hypothetical protein